MISSLAQHAVMYAAALALASLCGCDQQPSDAGPPSTAPAAAPRPVLWKQIEGESVVAVDEPRVQRELEKATAEARRTLDDARQRWSVSKPAERGLWAVKWAAPLGAALPSTTHAAEPSTRVSSDSTEHVWVQPLTWSAFRIEGVLLSTPTAPLECGRRAGERVSFPIDEVSDWIHFATAQGDSAFEGGYTVKVLREHFGDATRE